MSLLRKKEWDYVYRFYIVGFLSFISFIALVPIRAWMPNSIYSVCYMLFFGLGCLLILQDLLTQRCIFQTSLWWTVMACAGIMVFNTFFGRVGGSLGDDIKTTVWSLELVTICYSARVRLKEEDFEKTIKLALNLGLVIHSLAALASVVQALLGYTGIISARGVGFIQGFNGRLFGVYMNIGYPISIICLVLAIFFVASCKKWYQKIFYIFCIAVNYYSFLLENARASEVALLAGVACAAWILGRKYLYQKEGKAAIKEGIALIIAILCVMGVYFINYGCRTLAYYSTGNSFENSEVDEKNDSVARRSIWKRDVRIDIWKEYISAYSREMRPLGYNTSGYGEYLMECYPEEMEKVRVHKWAPHSGYIDALCRVGWIGMLFLVIWIVYHIWCSLRYIIRQINLSSEEIGCLAIIVIMMVNCIFGETAFWTFSTPEVMIFWLLAGDLTFKLRKRL